MLTLTLDGQPVDLPADAAVALSYRSSDLRRLDSREAAFSETFALPLSAQNARVLNTPHALSSQTTAPYRRLPAVLRANGVPVLRGVGLLEASEAGYELTLLDDTADLFAHLGNASLRALDLSALDHARTFAAVQGASTDSPARGYVYALADTARLAAAGTDEPVLFWEQPAAVYEAALVRALVAAALPGFALTGSLFTDPLFLKAVLPAVTAGPRLREAYRARFRVQAGAPADRTYQTLGTGTGGFAAAFHTLEFPALAAGPPAAFTGNAFYHGPAHRATVEVRGRLLVRNNGATLVYLYLLKGAGTAQRDILWSQTLQPGFRGAVTLNVSIPVFSDPDDGPLFLQVYNQFGGINTTSLTVYAGSAVTFAIGAGALVGAPVHLETTLPDCSQADYLRLLANRWNTLLAVDAAARTVRFDLFNELERRRADAPDWTAALDHGIRPRLDYRLPGYAQANEFTYAPAPDAYAPAFGTLAPAEAAAQVGRAALAVPDLTLPVRAEAYAAPAVLAVERDVCGGSARVAWLPTATPADPADPRDAVAYVVGGQYRKGDRVSRYGRTFTCTRPAFGVTPDPVDLNAVQEWTVDPLPDTEVAAVLVLVPLSATAPLLRADAQTAGGAPAQYRAALGLSRAGLSFAELLPAYHEGTARILGRVQLLTAYFTLSPAVLAALDFSRPVRLRVPWVAGYGPLSGYFYLNLVDQYRPGRPGSTRVELLRLGDPVPALAPAAPALPARPERLLLAEDGPPLLLEKTDYLEQER